MSRNPYHSLQRGKPGRIGWRIHYFRELTSTQDEAGRLAGEGAPQGTVVIAETQRAGRGRLGRAWFSPPGTNLYLTIVLRPEMRTGDVPQLSLVAGVAVAEAIEPFARGMVQLKWPNDIWLRGKKVGGILAQAFSGTNDELSHVLLGIGINVNLKAADLPGELRERASSMLIETDHRTNRPALAAKLLSRLDKRYREALKSGFDAIRPRWERFSALTGSEVTVTDGSSRQTGMVKGIDTDGALLLDTGGSVSRIMVGDVTLRGGG
jgi:BirA family biotin operon repressor/biotin-[acetyl-CoA-carboxylase] ligase